ncbi:MAG TPA: HlyD family efflux transporter periplasmic adaptor subunit [Gammaproteobacteria bacterium]|nr:HlyD family efflux transporter periplasmic adaptor subunit [Gammaproteobacteria bacterium]
MPDTKRGTFRAGRALAALAATALLAACARDDNPPLLGSLEWDRVAVTAELSEPVLRWNVAEGDHVEAGTVLLELDPRRQDARIAEARGTLMQAEGRLSELAHGATLETIDTARANLARARAAEVQAETDYARTADLLKRELVTATAADQALATRDQARAQTRANEAQLRELTRGTRPEQVEQAAAAVDAAKGALAALELTRERLTVRAPRAGRVDALPFHPGDQPPVGAELVSLLVGDAPYARVFVPAPRRAEVQPGDEFEISVEGVSTPFRAKVRSVRSEASFTPYYALSGDDATRLVYRAELVLEGAGAAELPAGLPVSARAVANERRN